MVYSNEHPEEMTTDTDYLKHYQEKLQGYFLSVVQTHHSLIEKFKFYIAKLSGDDLFESIEHICLLKILSKKIEEKEKKIQEEFLARSTISVSEPSQYDGIKQEIRRSKEDIKQLKSKLEQLSNHSFKQKLDSHSLLSYLHNNQMGVGLTANEDEEIVEFMNSDSSSRISQKVHLSNTIVSYMKGPVKVMVQGAMQAAEALAKTKHATEGVLQAVHQGLEKQKQMTIDNKRSFTEVTSDWIYEGENIDQGFSSASLWMRNPRSEKILIKIQDLPICAVNEWLAYVLGRKLGLPVNQVQIAIYEKNIVTLHHDVNQGNEKTLSFDSLPRSIKKTLMTDAIIGSMDIFDRLIMNVDRNPRNILITVADTTDLADENAKLKVHLIDHSACFGMGKLNGLSVMASKLHTNHLSVVKFDPIEEVKKFDRYLSKLSAQDRLLIGRTVSRLASITDQLIESWLTQVQSLLTPSQYGRIYGLLYRQCDIARRYTIQWRLESRPPSMNSKETL